MHESSSPVAVSSSKTSFVLDYGADAHKGHADLEISRHGMQFTCRWRFDIGTHLSFSLQLAPEKVITITGFVVESARTEGAHYRISLLFEESTPELRRILQKISAGMKEKSRPAKGGAVSPGKQSTRA